MTQHFLAAKAMLTNDVINEATKRRETDTTLQAVEKN